MTIVVIFTTSMSFIYYLLDSFKKKSIKAFKPNKNQIHSIKPFALDLATVYS